MITISKYDQRFINDIIQFRRDAYTHSGREPGQAHAWSRDEFDQTATHVVMYDDDAEKLIGVVRIIAGHRWTIEDYYGFDYD